MALFDATHCRPWTRPTTASLVFTNFVDFDMLYGHRRDVAGLCRCARGLRRSGCPISTASLQPGDIVILTADHGCDPTWRGTDHTRERVPILAVRPGSAQPLASASCQYLARISARPSPGISASTPGQHGRSFHVTAHLKKAELHCHIEGAAPPALALIQAEKYNVDISGNHPRTGPMSGQISASFLKCYDAVAELFKTEEDYARARRGLSDRSLPRPARSTAKSSFHPTTATRSALVPMPISRGLAAGIEAARAKTGIEARLIITGIRHLGPGSGVNAAAQYAAKARHTRWSPASTLAGEERMHKVADFARAFDIARDAGLGLTIHAGELSGAFSVRDALDHVRPSRISHGVRAIEDADLVQAARR